MDAPLVRAYLDALPDLPSDGKGLERVRFCLSSLLGPDVRYLVATVLGRDAPAIARVAAAVLRAAGTPTGVLGRSPAQTTVDGRPIDDALFAQAGTLTAASGYQLADSGRDLGQLTRREASVVLALAAFAEASQRVALIVDAGIDATDAAHAPHPDLVVIGDVDRQAAERALALLPAERPLVISALPATVRGHVEERVTAMGVPALLGDRDHRIDEREGRLVFSVRDEPYVTFDEVADIDRSALATGIAAALALGMMGIRMREEWVTQGIASLRPEPVG